MYLLFNPCTAIFMLNQLAKQMNRNEGLRMNESEKGRGGGWGVKINTIYMYWYIITIHNITSMFDVTIMTEHY